MKSYIWIIVIVVVLISLMVWAANNESGIQPAFEPGVIHPLDSVKGNASSGVIVTEYSDFECPACRTYYLALKQLAVEFGDRVAFVYRDFPLIEIHRNAEPAARAARAAGKQGKFWEMHDLLFEKQNEWTGVVDVWPMFESYAALLDLSPEQFAADWSSDEIKNIVRASRSHSVRLGLSSTPSFFINGEQIKNPGSYEEFRSIINGFLGNQ